MAAPLFIPPPQIGPGSEGWIMLEEQEYPWFRDLILKRAGIQLGPAKQQLLQARLQRRLAAHGCKRFADYRRLLESLPDGHPEWQHFVNALTTNKTDFYREPAHFKHLVEQVLPSLDLQPGARLRVWCAACSTGAEPYTLAAVLIRHLAPGVEFSILATDLDTEVLETAAKGVYPLAMLEPLPAEYRKGNFAQGTGEIADWFRVSKAIRDKVEFRQHNLLHLPYANDERFDVIFCRNVFIYFGRETIREVVNGMSDVADRGAHLYIGHAETLSGLGTRWRRVANAVYKRS